MQEVAVTILARMFAEREFLQQIMRESVVALASTDLIESERDCSTASVYLLKGNDSSDLHVEP